MKRFILVFLIVMTGIVMFGCGSKSDNSLSSTKAITEFNFTNPDETGVINETTHEINISVPIGTDVTSLIPTITHTGVSINPASGAAQNFTNPVIYTVTAADSSTQTYTVTITFDPTITAFNFSNPHATGVVSQDTLDIAITVPYETDVTSLIPTITHTGVSINPASGAAQNFTNPVTYTVTAADSSTQEYVVTVTIASASAKAITSFNFTNPSATGVINEISFGINVTVPIGTNTTSLVPSITHTGDGINPASGEAQNFTNPVTYTVTAGDLSTRAYVVTVRPVLPLAMIPVPAGTFNRDGVSGNDSTVSAFQISEKEITVEQFTTVTELANPSSSFTSVVDGPVQYVNWYHALVFCNKLSMREGLTPVYTIDGSTNPADWGTVPTAGNATWDAVTANWSADGYRLPTEMEWMWAAMGATSGSGYTGGTYTTGYQKEFSGDPNPTTGSDPIDNYAWTSGNSANTTHSVGTKLPNELLLYDMSGNVFEWCWDWCDTYPTGALSDYKGAASGTDRVGRGGAWILGAEVATVAYRAEAHVIPSSQYDFVGFRVVRH